MFQFLRKKNRIKVNGSDNSEIFYTNKIYNDRKENWIRIDAEKYAEIGGGDLSAPIKFIYKTGHFLRWATKLLVPDFLIGHPNLFDNLKLLARNPQFKPLRAALVAWLIFTMVAGSTGIYSLISAPRTLASTLADDTQAEFDAGTYSDTQFDAGNSWVELDATGLTNGSGNYTSSVKDAGGSSSWDTIAWVPERPTGKELPDSAASETAYNSG
ncbi:MAG: hypothetical protein Q8Q48_02610, partial [Candidatus Staskawiczbacteria bacterium]|nr:hypothetical protein [Candidatus Staskawiczbacteria bacterium]